MESIETSSPFRGRRRNTAIIGILCAAMLLACPLGVAIDNGDVVEETDAVLPVVVVYGAILLVGMVMGSVGQQLADSYGDGDVPEGADQEDVNAGYREMQAELVSSNYSTASGIWSRLADNDAQLWSFVESYFDLQAETAVAALWSDVKDYDGDDILVQSSLISNALTYNYNLISAWNEFVESWSDYRDLWQEGGDAYDSMTVSFGWDADDWSSSGVFAPELARFVTPTSQSDRVYIDVVEETDGQEFYDRTNILYCTAQGTLTSVTTGETTVLNEGENDLLALGLESGWYELGTGSTYISQNFGGSVSSDGLMPTACMLIRNGDSYAYAYESGDSFVIVRDGYSTVSESLTLTISYDDQDGNVVDDNVVDLGTVLSAYDNVSDALNDAFVSTNFAGETAWNLFDELGQSSALIKPSSITSGTQNDYPLTSQQAAVMYIAAMEQLAALGEGATSDGIQISPDSFNLIVYGDIYYEGVLIAEDAVYTPFVYGSTDISVGEQILDVNGLAMVWATGVSSLEDWDGVTDNSAVISISGATLFTMNIVEDGVEVSETHLEVESMERLGLIGFDVPDVPEPPETVDIVPLIQIIIVLIGAIVAVAGLFTRNFWLILIGALVAVVGYFLASYIAGLVY